MPKRPIAFDDAIITSVVRYSEADCIVRIFARDLGRLSVFMRNGLKPSKSRGGMVQAPSLCRVGIVETPTSNWARLVELDVSPLTFALANNLRSLAFAAYLAEISEVFLAEGIVAANYFNEISMALKPLPLANNHATIARAIELKLLKECGYLAEFCDLALSKEAVLAAETLITTKDLSKINYDEPVLREIALLFLERLKTYRTRPLNSMNFFKAIL